MKHKNFRTGLQLKYLVMGLWMVLLAVGLRLAGTTATGTMLSNIDVGQACRLAGECLRPQSVTAVTASEEVAQPEKPPNEEPPSEPEPKQALEPLIFTGQEADAIAIGGSAQSAVDKATLLLTPLEMQTEPLVLIVHTHTSEAYTPEAGWEYTPTDAYRTSDANYNVVRVGEALAQELEQCGIGVIHDTTVNDNPEYQGAYERSFDCIQAQLAAHPSIQIVLDIHRDALEDSEGNALPKLTQIEGADCAQLMLVVGTDEGGLYHPNWKENLSFALKLQALLNRTTPTLCRDISLRKERFNQQFTPCSLLVEVGATGNTLAQALPSARYLARALAQLISAGTAADGAASIE